MVKITNVNDRQVIDYMARDYESFKKAMIDLIPGRLPEWTDRSEADFGIVLVELFAYMADILSYYQDRIANESFLATANERRSIIQHLRLIGYELEPANPASADLVLEFPNSATGKVNVVKGDRFSTKSGKDKKPVYFEYVLDAGLEIDLDKLVNDSGSKKGFKKYPSVPVEIKESPGTSGGLAYQRYKLSYPGVDTQSLKITIGGDTWAAKNTLDYSGKNDNHYTLSTSGGSAVILFGDGIHGRIPGPGRNIEVVYKALLPGIPVKEGKTVTGTDFLGESDGSPNQFFRLTQSPAIKDSLEVRVNGIIWSFRDTLIFSDSDSTHYGVQIDENDVASIVFGDGEFGRIPDTGARIEAVYRVGGGSHGNVGASEITQIVSAKEIPSTAVLSNDKPATGGSDRETIDYAVKHAPQQFRSRERAVTENDLIVLAKRKFKGCKVKARDSSWNFIDLYFAPAGGGIATTELKREVREYFEDKRMVATIIRVKDPTYVGIELAGKVTVMPNYVKKDVAYTVNQTAAGLYKFDAVDFGQNLYLSKVYEAIEAIDGVSHVYIEKFNREDDLSAQKIPANGVITMDWDEIPEIRKTDIPIEGGY